MFITASFLIVQTENNQTAYLLEWMHKLYIHTTKRYAPTATTTKKPVAATYKPWVKLTVILMNKRSQHENCICITPFLKS